VEEIWNNFKNIVYESIERFVPQKTLRKNSDPEYYNTEIKLLKSKVGKGYKRRKLGVHCTEKLKKNIQAATCIQEIGTGGILKINTKQRW
jgi:hypothetical protein